MLNLTGTKRASTAITILGGLIIFVFIVFLSSVPPSCLAQNLEPQPVPTYPKIIQDKMILVPDKTVLNLKVDRVVLRQTSPDDVHETLLKVTVPKAKL